VEPHIDVLTVKHVMHINKITQCNKPTYKLMEKNHLSLAG